MRKSSLEICIGSWNGKDRLGWQRGGRPWISWCLMMLSVLTKPLEVESDQRDGQLLHWGPICHITASMITLPPLNVTLSLILCDIFCLEIFSRALKDWVVKSLIAIQYYWLSGSYFDRYWSILQQCKGYYWCFDKILITMRSLSVWWSVMWI